MTVGRVQLVRELSDLCEFPQQYWAKQILEMVFYIITDHLVSGHTITIRGLGTFSVKEMPAHRARNIGTGEAFQVPSRKYVHFRASPSLKAQINGEKKLGEPVPPPEEIPYDPNDLVFF